MNSTAKNVIRVAGVVAGLGAAIWALRDRLLPAPELHPEPPPRFREVSPPPAADATRPTAPKAPAGAETRPLTDINGVGPVTADKLRAAGFADASAVAATSAADLAAAVATSEATAGKWIASAKSLT